MKIAFIIYNKFTALDFIGVYDPITRLKTMNFISDLHWDICSNQKNVKDISGLLFKATKINNSLSKYDIVIIPGGVGTRGLINNEKFISWIKTAKNCKLKVSVCTGSLILGKAGFLKDKIATTHPASFNLLKV